MAAGVPRVVYRDIYTGRYTQNIYTGRHTWASFLLAGEAYLDLIPPSLGGINGHKPVVLRGINGHKPVVLRGIQGGIAQWCTGRHSPVVYRKVVYPGW